MKAVGEQRFIPMKMVDIELGQPLADIWVSPAEAVVRALVRLDGVPLGYCDLAADHGVCRAEEQRRRAEDACRAMVLFQLAGKRLDQLQRQVFPPEVMTWPRLTVAVCTRDRPGDLRLCLESIARLDYPDLEILVVDNAAADTATRDLVATAFPWARYLVEARPGLSWARNCAIQQASGEIIAFTDDDVIVDQAWARGLAEVYAADPTVMAVTGLVVPYELATRAQYHFELYDGFGRGFVRKWFRIPGGQANAAFFHGGTGGLGTGANMSFRRTLFGQVGFFDTALGAGTLSRGGEDLEMFFRIIKEGHLLVYEPRAIVRHRHRRDDAALASQIADWGLASTAYLVGTGYRYKNEIPAVTAQWFGRLLCRNIPRLLASVLWPKICIRRLICQELSGSFIGLGRYRQAVAAKAGIVAQFGGEHFSAVATATNRGDRGHGLGRGVAQRMLDLAQPITTMDLTAYHRVSLGLSFQGAFLGRMTIANCHRPLSAMRIRDAILDRFAAKLLAAPHSPVAGSWRQAAED